MADFYLLFGYLDLIAEFIVRERNDKLRNVLTDMGCDFRAYWTGTFLVDYPIMPIPMIVRVVFLSVAALHRGAGGLYLSVLVGVRQPSASCPSSSFC